PCPTPPFCPSCPSPYQLDPGLRGQRMRCPNPVCREVFEVQDAEPEQAEPRRAGSEPVTTPPVVEPAAPAHPREHLEKPPRGIVRTMGSVGDMVPILDAEVVH